MVLLTYCERTSKLGYGYHNINLIYANLHLLSNLGMELRRSLDGGATYAPAPLKFWDFILPIYIYINFNLLHVMCVLVTYITRRKTNLTVRNIQVVKDEYKLFTNQGSIDMNLPDLIHKRES